MATNNSVNNTLASPFTIGATSVTSTGTQLNLLNGLTVVPINKVVLQTFTASGTYTPTTGMVYCIIECWGGGGGGGGIANTIAGRSGTAASGGAGAYSQIISTAATIGASQTVTIGTAGTGGSAGNNNGGSGGSTSVGTICVAVGGSGGTGSPNAGIVNAGAGGAAASGTGTIKLTGNAGQNGSGYQILTLAPQITQGGITTLGGGQTGGATVQANGTAGTANTGTGGNGGCSYNAGGAASGGDGGTGYIVITEFVSA